MHLPVLIQDLALILAAAAVTTMLFRKLKQPVVLGYIIAGLIVGPHFSFTPSISDRESIKIWAEIGVIFLLFGLGLEFSFKKVMKVGGASSVTAFVEIGTMLLVGYATGQMLGWSTTDSLFLSAILSVASTTIIIRAFDELGVKSKKYASLVFGILVIEDLVAVVLLALLSTLAITQQFSGMEMLFSVAKLVLFLVLWFVTGIFFLPSLLRRWKSVMTNEMLLITSLALCLGMVVLATSVGFSPAFGAFIMGSILAETTLGEKIEQLTTSVRELFGAVFFVSVGMLIEPSVLVAYIGPILIITVVLIVFKTLATSVGALISGQPVKQSVQAGMSLAQIGEFSFIIATLGLSLNVTSPFLYPITVAVSSVTAFTTPYMIRASGPVQQWLSARLPGRVKEALNRYSLNAQTMKRTSDWRIVLRSSLLQILLYGNLLAAIILVIDTYVMPAILARGSGWPLRIASTLVVLVGLLPIFWAMALRKIHPIETNRLIADRVYRGPLVMLQLVRIASALLLVVFLVNAFLSTYAALGIIAFIALMAAFGKERLQRIYDRIEEQFLANFNDREAEESRERGHHLTPWDAHIVRFTIEPGFDGLGKTLMELRLREEIGVNIARIRRSGQIINVPPRDEVLYPGDVIYVIGTDDQVELLKTYLLQHTTEVSSNIPSDQEISLEQFVVRPGSNLDGKTIKQSAIRERTKGLIVGIERNEERILNPESSVELQAGDRLWIVGNARRIRVLDERQIRSSASLRE